MLQPVCIPQDAGEKTVNTIGWRSSLMSKDKLPFRDDEAMRSVSYKGELTHEIKNDVLYGVGVYNRMTSEFRAAADLAKQCKPTCNVIHESALGRKFFDMSPKYAKAYVMVGDDIKKGDTVRFRHKDNETDYKVFVEEVDPAPAPNGSLAWWVTAFVQVEGPVSETILVESSSKVS